MNSYIFEYWRIVHCNYLDDLVAAPPRKQTVTFSGPSVLAAALCAIKKRF
jgi:hypothetical protein